MVGNIVKTRGWVMRDPPPHWPPGRVLRVISDRPPPPFDYTVRDRHGETAHVFVCEIVPVAEAREP